MNLKDFFRITEKRIIITVILSVSFLVLSLALAIYSIPERLPDDNEWKRTHTAIQTAIVIMNPITLVLAWAQNIYFNAIVESPIYTQYLTIFRMIFFPMFILFQFLYCFFIISLFGFIAKKIKKQNFAP